MLAHSRPLPLTRLLPTPLAETAVRPPSRSAPGSRTPRTRVTRSGGRAGCGLICAVSFRSVLARNDSSKTSSLFSNHSRRDRPAQQPLEPLPRPLDQELHRPGVLHRSIGVHPSRAVVDGSHIRALKDGPNPDRARSTVPELARNTSDHRSARHPVGRHPAVTTTTSHPTHPVDPGRPPYVAAAGVPPTPGDGLRRPRLRPRQIPQTGPGGPDQAVIARRGGEHGSGLGRYRWVVEQSFALLHWFRRLRIRWEIRNAIHEAFLLRHHLLAPTGQSRTLLGG
jgi:hypothetical protein